MPILKQSRARDLRVHTSTGALAWAVAGLIGASFATTAHAINPIDDGWYADPEGAVYGDTYWIFPTTSDDYQNQTHFDAFSSTDLVTWTKHENIFTSSDVGWTATDRAGNAYQARIDAMWAPSTIEKDGKYYLFYGAKDIQPSGGPWYDPYNQRIPGGIGVAVADTPGGQYSAYLDAPLISTYENGAQPIDQFVFNDDGTYYMYYGGRQHLNVAILNEDFTGFETFDTGETFREITPDGYVEGPVVFKREGTYYAMWSEGYWGSDNYRVVYGMSDSPVGEFEEIGEVLSSDAEIATGAGHNSVINKPGTDEWYIVYHRRPIPNEDRDHRVTAVDLLEFNTDGTIKPVVMTFDGVPANPIPEPASMLLLGGAAMLLGRRRRH